MNKQIIVGNMYPIKMQPLVADPIPLVVSLVVFPHSRVKVSMQIYVKSLLANAKLCLINA